jgi:PAS domain S-box-containing protein
MALAFRNTGISVVGDVPWGTHFCCFYETKQDLLDTLVPYFKAGLQNNEFCLWVVSDSELITTAEAKAALAQAIPDLDQQVANGHIEILDALNFYLEENVFNSQQAVNAWDARLKQALALGYEGMRGSGDTIWLTGRDWKDFCAYEKHVNDSMNARPMMLLCTYALARSGAAEILDVARNHQFAIARRRGVWEVVKSLELLQANAEIKRLTEALQRLIKRTPKPSVILRYGLAGLSVAAALIITLWMRREIGQPSTPIVAMFLCAVMFSAWFGGIRPGLLSIVLSLAAIDYYFVPPLHSFSPDIKEIPRLLVFAVSGLFVGLLSAAQRNAAESVRRARDILDETVQELTRSNQALRTENIERKHAEELLHAKEQEFRAIVENAPDQIIRYDRDFRRVYVNPAVAKFYDLPGDALIGKPFGSGIQETKLDVKKDELAQVRERIAAVFETGQTYDYELRWTRPTGTSYFSVRLFPELDLTGAVVNVLGISRDITEIKLADEELKKEKELLEKIFDNIPLMIGFVGEDDRIELVNSEWERTIGWTLKELHEQNVDVFAEAYPDLSYRQKVRDFVAASTGEWVDLKIRVREGRVIDAACAVVHLSDGTRVAIAQDITERKRAEERIKAASEQLRALSARVQSVKEEEDIRIAREIHDEMGSTLTSLRWELERLDQTISEAETFSQGQSLRVKIAEMMSMTDITIATMRRIASELRPGILDDLGLEEAIEWETRQFESRTGIDCRCDCSVADLHFDPKQSTAIFRILREALTNVMGHAGATRVEVVAREENGEFVLTISDDGRGIRDEEKSGRLSLGILGMRERAHLIGGEFEINRLEVKGTIVTVRVPIS